jgi:hypothetical protein
VAYVLVEKEGKLDRRKGSKKARTEYKQRNQKNEFSDHYSDEREWLAHTSVQYIWVSGTR